MVKSYYDILALPKNATSDQIRARFYELVRQRHPDRFSGEAKERAEKEFQEITAAFNALASPERRRLHDLELSRPQVQKQGPDPGSLARVYLQRGVKSYKEKNYLQAAESFDRASKAQPDNAKAWHYLALACSHQRRWLSRATAAIAQACELEPMNADYLKLAGRLFQSAGMTLRAEQYYNESLKWGGEDPAVERRLSELRKAAKKGKGFFGKAD